MALGPEQAALPYVMLRACDDQRFQAGSAEPWIAALIATLVFANGTKTAIEIGGFQGYTSAHIAAALSRLPYETVFTVCEIDQQRAQDVQKVLDMGYGFRLRTHVVCDDSHRWLPTLPERSVDFAWVDGNHEKAHVARELELLWPKMRDKGLICLHDVWGVCDLQDVVRRYPNSLSLDLPRLGPAGGVGIIQVRH